MATTQWSPPASPPAANQYRRPAPAALGLALLALCLYAVFAGGGIGNPNASRLEVAAAVVALGAALGLISGHLRAPLPGTARSATALLLAFAAVCGLSILWSASPDRSWLEFNRVLAYALVAGAASVFAASVARPAEQVRCSLQILGSLLVVYALGQKVLPGLRVAGLIDLNQTGRYARLQAPLGYWNALALALVCTLPATLVAALRVTSSRRARTVALITLQLTIVAIGFTESRGGIAVGVLVLLLTVVASGDVLRHAAWSALVILGGVAPLAVGLSAHALSSDGVPLASRESSGLLLGLVLLAAATLVGVAASRGYELELHVVLSEERRTRLVRVLAGTCACALITAGLIYVLGGGLHGLTSPQQASVSSPDRLFSTDSADRLEWWRQALGAWRDRPLLGWGAGSFPVIDLLYRHDTLTALQAHSVPLEWLGETGLVGTLLAVAAWVVLLRGGFASLGGGRAERPARLALLLAGIAYALHAFYDWDWQIPGVTLPVLVALGVLAADRPVPAGQPAPAASGGRLAFLAAVTVAGCLYVVSAVLPGIAATRASRAEVEAAAGRLQEAQHDATLATRLDPLSDVGPLASEAVALQLRDLRRAQSDLLEALDREPDDADAWRNLVTVDIDLGSFRAAVTAAQRALALDPRATGAAALSDALAARGAEVSETPPGESVTAQP